MENEIQPSAPPVQPIPQTTPNLSQSINWSRISLFTLLGLVFIAGSIFVGFQMGKTQAPSQQPIVVQPTASPAQVVVQPTVTPATSPITDATTNWKTYTSTRYTLKYPAEWIVDEKCTKLEYPTNNPCIYSSDYHPVTKKIDPGEGGDDTVTEYNLGTFLNINSLENVTYDSTGFCSPGGPVSVDNCHEKIINGNRYALREIGSYPYPTTSVNAWLLKDNKGVIELHYSFSKENKVKDLQLFDQILATFKEID